MKRIFNLFVLLIVSSNVSAQLSWLKLPDFPGGNRFAVSSFSINGKGYIGLGVDSTTQGYSDLYEFDPISNQWAQKTSLPGTGRWATGVFVIGTKAYIACGAINGGSRTNQLWEYDQPTDTWTQKTSFIGSVRQSPATFSIGNKGYLGTGYIGSGSVNDFYEYDQATDTWSQKSDFPGIVRNGSAGFSIGSTGYVGMGNGNNSTNYYQDLYSYEPNTDTWTQKADFTLPYVNSMCTYSSANSAYILCGYYYQFTGVSHNPLNMLYKYDSGSDSWTLEGTFPGLPRGYAGGFSLNNDIYIGAGSQSNDLTGRVLNDFWKLSNGLTLKISDIDSYNDFVIYPNPSQEKIEIRNTTGEIILLSRIYDSIGRLIETSYSKDNINISKFNNGLYFIEIVTKSGRVLDGRFIKN
jgi:N-acetylneuraminic acid mutarotase